ncbi:MAG: hypothetical protein RIS94_630 [Pseudomonadota bacterium]|jgi:hypothetical protein
MTASSRSLLGAVCAGLLALIAPHAVLAADAVEGPQQVLVMLRLGADHFRAGSDYGGDYGDQMGEKARARLARKVAREHHLLLDERWAMPLIGVDCVLMTIPDARSAEMVADELSHAPGVSWSQPLNRFEAQAAAPLGPATYNDRLYRAQPASARWHLAALHQVSTGRGVTIAVVDSQIDRTHPDLAGQVIDTLDFAPVPAAPGGESHGTGVAGIIAAHAGNGVGIAGVAPGARILGLRACVERSPTRTTCDSLSLAKAINTAITRRADVINLSLSGPADRLLAALVGVALARGTAVVAAIDPARPQASFPAMLPGVIPVTDDRLSSREAAVYIAPGRDVPTTEPEGKWDLVNGSSFAAAHVSGLAALVRQVSRGRAGSVALALGPRGMVDACATLARVSTLDARACASR